MVVFVSDWLNTFGLVVYEPEYRLITDTILCEDGHAHERSLFPRLLGLAEAKLRNRINR
ncbi:MAG: hypothetical protein LBJ67_17475 [Planctomycetaceae bacterium]|jgi:hypothetical protein|nr:hypothetical protein [Planctomycetaceae bacterium]